MAQKLKGWGIFIGLIAGCLIGLLFNSLKTSPEYGFAVEAIVDNLFSPVGKVFFQALFMIVVPLVFSSLVVGIADISHPASFGRLSKRLFIFYAISTFIAILIGQICMGTLRPGDWIPQDEVQKAAVEMQDKMSSVKAKSSMVGAELWPGILTRIVPRNIIDQFAEENILAVIFVSLLFGFGLLYMPNGPPKESFIHIMSALSSLSITIIQWVMKTAPFAVAALVATSVFILGWNFIQTMMFYMLVMALGMAVHLFVTYGLFLRFLIRIPIKEFFLRMMPALSTAFGTSSSSATMPVTMDTLEKNFGAPKKIVRFSIPVGATVNMDGTALFEMAAAVFIAQLAGVSLSWTSIIILAFLVFITSVGIAGVPGASIPILMSAIVFLGLPPEGIALILGVDRLMDMGRTMVNVTGDSIAALYLTRKEGIDINGYIKNHPR